MVTGPFRLDYFKISTVSVLRMKWFNIFGGEREKEREKKRERKRDKMEMSFYHLLKKNPFLRNKLLTKRQS